MSQMLHCTSCNKEFVAADDGSAVWLICPHCGGREPNPLALDRRTHVPRSFSPVTCMGALLIAFGTLLLVPGSCGMLFIGGLRPGGEPQIAVVFFGSLLAVGGGFVLLRLARRQRLAASPQVGQTYALAILIGLAAVAGFLFALVTCFG